MSIILGRAGALCGSGDGSRGPACTRLGRPWPPRSVPLTVRVPRSAMTRDTHRQFSVAGSRREDAAIHRWRDDGLPYDPQTERLAPVPGHQREYARQRAVAHCYDRGRVRARQVPCQHGDRRAGAAAGGARGQEGLEAARAEVDSLGGEAPVLAADVADARQLEQAAETLEQGNRRRRSSLRIFSLISARSKAVSIVSSCWHSQRPSI